jgi:hypothetical protein
MVEATSTGKHEIKGKADPQSLYRLDAVRDGALRFEASVTRGLSAFVGRERELEVLEHCLDDTESGLRIADVVADPGMGKSRLLYEFRRRIGSGRAIVIGGNCSADGQQTAFRPFLDIVRGSFRVSAGQSQNEVAQQLEIGLTTLGLHSMRTLNLLLHLLGLPVLEDSLSGLDGVLIGLRTRDLLKQMLAALCRLSSVVMVIEDLQWIDSASEELLSRIVDSGTRVLIIHTRRQHYIPPWLHGPKVRRLPLKPLSALHILRLVQSRLAVEVLPKALAGQVTEKADGNPLFAEEIVSFLIERGMLRVSTGRLEFDANAAAKSLPASLQSLLTARIDRLSPKDRALLQAASVVGRRFDPRLLAAAVGDSGEFDNRLAELQSLGLIRAHRRTHDYLFKHALVRDALYQSLLSETRETVHLRIAREIERRSGDRLTEVAEVLAHHYSQSANDGKAFAYLVMAGHKCLGVYSLDEAANHFAGALVLLDKNPQCASDEQVAGYLALYTQLLNMNLKLFATIDIVRRYLGRIDRLADDLRVVLIRHHYAFALLWNTRNQEAAFIQQQALQMANRLGDSKSRAYALAGEIQVSTFVTPKTLEEYELLKADSIKMASETEDAYIQIWTRYVIGWEEIHRGRINDARCAAHDLMDVGRILNDPRATGFGFYLLAWIALIFDSHAEALEYCEQSLVVAVTPLERNGVLNAKGCSLILLRRIEDGVNILESFRRRCLVDGDLYSLVSCDVCLALAEIFRGNIGHGIRFIENRIVREGKEGHNNTVDWYRGFLAEIYLQIVTGSETLPITKLIKNMLLLLRIRITAYTYVRTSMLEVTRNPRYHPGGLAIGRAHMILGLLYKAKNRRKHADHYLTEARRILSQFGTSPLLTRIDAALATLR